MVTTGAGPLSSFSASVMSTIRNEMIRLDRKSLSSTQYQLSRYLTAEDASPGAEGDSAEP